MLTDRMRYTDSSKWMVRNYAYGSQKEVSFSCTSTDLNSWLCRDMGLDLSSAVRGALFLSGVVPKHTGYMEKRIFGCRFIFCSEWICHRTQLPSSIQNDSAICFLLFHDQAICAYLSCISHVFALYALCGLGICLV